MAVEQISKTKYAINKYLVVVNSLSSVVTRLLNVFVLAWMYQYMLGKISAQEFAVYPVIAAVMVFAPLFFSIFTGGISRHITDACAKDDLLGVRKIISSIFPFLTLLTAIFLVLGLIFAFNIEKVFNITQNMVDDAHLMVSLLVVSFALKMLLLPFSVGHHVRQKFVELNILTVARELLRISILLFLLLGVGPSIVWIVLATFLSNITFDLVICFRSLQILPSLQFELKLFKLSKARELISFGLWTTVGQMGAIMYTNAATMVLNLYSSAIDVTSYFIGVTLFQQIDALIRTAIMPLQPAITVMNAMAEKERLKRTVFRGGRYALWVSMIIAAPLSIFCGEFTVLYLGAGYSNAAVVLLLFMIIFPFNQGTVLLPITAMALARVREFFLPAFIFQFLGMVLMLFFAIKLNMGAVGVTLSLSIITVVSQLTYFWALLLKFTAVDFRIFFNQVLLPGLLPALSGCVVWGTLKLTLLADSWFKLGFFAALGGVVYLLTLFRFCLNTDELKDIKFMLVKIRVWRMPTSK